MRLQRRFYLLYENSFHVITDEALSAGRDDEIADGTNAGCVGPG